MVGLAAVVLVAALPGCAKQAGPETFAEWAQSATLGGTRPTELSSASGVQQTGHEACGMFRDSATFEQAVEALSTRLERLTPARGEVVELLTAAVVNVCPQHEGKLP